MRLRKFFLTRLAAFVFGLVLGGFPGWAGAASYTGHQAVAGDFNGDGWTDFILQPVSGYNTVGELIAYQDGNFGAPLSTWPEERGGTDWNADAHRIVVGDWNADGRDDLILQGAAGLSSEEYLAGRDGSFPGKGTTLPATLGGLDPSQASHALVVGDFNGDGRDDLLLQANVFVGTNGIALAGPRGKFGALAASWKDGKLGFGWSADRAVPVAGDFDGSGGDEVLVRSTAAAGGADTCCRVVAFGSKLVPGSIRQSWHTDWLGVDWRTATTKIIVADLNGDKRDDLLVQPRHPGGSDLYVLLAGQDGKFHKVADHWPSTRGGMDWSAASYKLVAESGTSGKGATLAMIPQQTGLAYRQASFDAQGRLAGVKRLTSPPPDALAAAGGGIGSEEGGSAPHASTRGLRPHASAPAGDAVGAMAGKASVSNGAAGYSIPIAVPPGRAGMAPSLTLGYSSNGGDGHEGVGWSLGGLSSIYRCPATKASDGYTAGTTFTYSDRFCLDGQKLKLASGDYGKSGSTYHTEVNGFSLITAHGTTGNGPSHFTVKTPAGHTLTYSAMISKTNGNNTGVFTWALTKDVDLDGNKVVYHYTRKPGEYYPHEIDYTLGHGGTTRKVTFEWEKRTAAGASDIVHYLAGMTLRTTRLLTHVRTWVGGQKVRDYTLDYKTSPATQRPLLDWARVCAYQGSEEHCFNPTTFSYAGQHALKFSSVATTALTELNIQVSHDCPLMGNQSGFSWNTVHDVDGDGRVDLVSAYGLLDAQGHAGGGVGTAVQFSKYDGSYTTPQTQEITAPSDHSFLAYTDNIDFNLDGRTDILIADWDNHDTLRLKVLYTTASASHSFQMHGTGISLPSNTFSAMPHVADINGDGKPDLVLELLRGTIENLSHEWRAYLASGHGIDTTWTLSQTLPINANFVANIDYDADGRTDILVHKKNSGQYTLLHSTRSSSGIITLVAEQTGIPYVSDPQAKDKATPLVADVNGDSLPDIVEANKTGSGAWHWMIYLNKGSKSGQFHGPIDTGLSVAETTYKDRTYKLFSGVRVLHEPDGRDDLLVPTARSYVAPELSPIQQCPHGKAGPCKGVRWEGPQCKDFWNIRTSFLPSRQDGYDWSLYKAVITEGGTPNLENEGVVAHDLERTKFLIDFDADGLPDILGTDPHPSQPNAFRAYRLSFGNGAAGGPVPDSMIKVDNAGFGVVHRFDYKPLTSSVYTRGNGSTYPNMLFASSMQVVSKMTVTNPVDGTNAYHYHYTGARYNVAGRGFAGFESVEVTNERAKTVTKTTYKQGFPFIGRVREKVTWAKAHANDGQKWLSKNTTDWKTAQPSGVNYSVAYAKRQVAKTREPDDGYPIIQTITTKQDSPNACGHPQWSNRETTNAQLNANVHTTFDRPGDGAGNCWNDLLTNKIVKSHVSYSKTPTTSDDTKITTKYKYDANHHVIRKKATSGHGGVSAVRLETYGYDTYGNRTSVTAHDGNTKRTVTTIYGAAGYFPATVKNTKFRVASFTYDAAIGKKTSKTDANGCVTTYAWDAFGRTAGGLPCGQSAVSITYENASAEVCPPHTAYAVKRTQAGYPASYTCKDAFGHTLRTATESFNGARRMVDSAYNALGRLRTKSAPYLPNKPVYRTHYDDYDVLGRVGKKTIPTADGPRTVEMSHGGLTITYTDTASGATHRYKHTYDGLGKGKGHLVQVDQKNGGAWIHATYRYDAGGHLIRATDPAGNAIQATYDGFGDKLKLDDPDKGEWHYAYNGFGELTQSTDAMGHTLTTRHDELGRKSKRTNTATGRVSTWVYGTAQNGLGKPALARVENNGTTLYSKRYGYDAAGRATVSEVTTDGQTYLSAGDYNANGRPRRHSYPSLAGGGNHAPTLSAGATPAGPVEPGATVALAGAGHDADGEWTLAYRWEETGGPGATITDAHTASAHVTLSGPGTYHFKVTVTDGLASASDTVTLVVKNPPGGQATPSASPNPSYTGTYTVSWESIAGASRYQLQESKDGRAWHTKSNDAGRSWQATGRAAGTYRYRVRGCNAVGCGPWGAAASETVTAPTGHTTPTAGSGTSYTGTFSVSWASIAHASRYKLQESKDGGAWQTRSNDGNRSWTATNRTAGSYRYRVRGCDAVGCGPWGGTRTVTVTAPAGQATPAVDPESSYTGAFTVSWASIAHASRYKLQESKDGGTWHTKSNDAGRSWQATGHGAGTYRYRVRGCDTVGCGPWGGTATAHVVAPPAPAAPLVGPDPSHTGSFTVSWGRTNHAQSYRLQERVGSGGWHQVQHGSARDWDTSGRSRATYHYRVRACNATTGCGGWSAVASEHVSAPPAPGGLRMSPQPSHDGSFKVSWHAASGASSYRLQERKGTGDWHQIYSGSSRSKRLSGRSSGFYYYRVRACNTTTGCGAWKARIGGEHVSAPPAPARPSVSPNPTHDGRYTVNWGSVSAATSYRLQASRNGGSWHQVYSGSARSKAFSGKSNGSYRYRVRSCNATTGCGGWSGAQTEQVAWIPAAPSGLEADYPRPPPLLSPGAAYTLSWNAAAHATSYQLAQNGTTPSQTGIGGTSKGETAPSRYDVSVTWRVRACGPGGCSAWSDPVTVLTQIVPPGGGDGPNCPPICTDPKVAGGGMQPLAASGSGASGPGALTIRTHYNAHGYPQALTRTSDGYSYVTVEAMDAFGHATILHEGNGVTVTRGFDQATGLALSTDASGPHVTIAHLKTRWDGFGNLKKRVDAKNNSTQTATYDALNRLTATSLTYTLAGGGTRSRSFTYDATGNRTQACAGATCTSYGYGGSGYGPHALTGVNGSTSAYAYNANGEMIHDGDKSLTWTPFGKVSQISGPSTVTFSYGPAQKRIKKTVEKSDETVLYLQGAEKLTVNGGTSIRRTLTFAGVHILDTGGANAKLLYAVKDHLGSTMALSNANGQSAQQMSFSPFGKRRTTAWAQPMSNNTAWSINTTQTDKGYTGQESLDAVGLVNFNARLYDPELGRFLSTDPMIAHPGSTQAINPYSYVENNPLNKTDPTGMASTCVGDKGAGCNVSVKGSSVTVNPNKGTVTVNHADGTSQTVSVGKSAANAMSAGAQAMFGPSVVQQGVATEQGAKPASTGFDTNTHSGKAGKVTSNTSAPTDTGSSSNELSKAAPNTSDPKNYRLYLVALSADGDFPTGHAFIGGITPNGKIEAEGFYASNKNWAGAIIGQNVPGKSKSDLTRFKEALQGDKSFALLRADVDRKTYERVMSEMRNYDQFHKYNLYHDNCVTAAETTWYKNGLSKRRFGDWTPTELYNRIKGISTGSLSPIYRP